MPYERLAFPLLVAVLLSLSLGVTLIQMRSVGAYTPHKAAAVSTSFTSR
jgi:hypothetical protein